MPVKPTVWTGASSLIVMGFGASSVGRSLTGLTVTVKVRTTVLLALWPSLTVTVMVAVPNASATGLKSSAPVLFGLEYCTTGGSGMRAGLLEIADTVNG